MRSDKFTIVKVGDQASVRHRITRKDVQKFAALTGDTNPLHVDEDFAERTTFKKNVAHGMLSAAFVSTLIGTKLPGKGALWFSQSLSFLRPVWIDDEITVCGEVIQKVESQRTLKIKIAVTNQHGQPVISGECLVNVLREKVTDEAPNSDHALTAVVIGGTGGIGRAIVQRLLEQKFQVVFTFNNAREVAERMTSELSQGGNKVIAVKTDVTQESDITALREAAVAAYGGVDVLINTATGKIIPKEFEETEWAGFEQQLLTQLKGTYLLCKQFVPLFKQRGRGKVICLSSSYADGVPPRAMHGYVVAKAALNGLMKTLAVEYGPKGLTFNLVSPSMTETSLSADVPEKVKMLTIAHTPLRRLALPRDVAGAVCFLAGAESNFITGENIRVTGGQVML